MDAKRRILDVAQRAIANDPAGKFFTNGEHAAGSMVLRLLAVPYAGHPDYDESWRPQ